MKKLKLKRTVPSPAQIAAREKNYTLFRLAGIQAHLGNIKYTYPWDAELHAALNAASDAVDTVVTILKEKGKEKNDA